ncbi:MAG: OmpH family outer membrane protein [Selenomonadaceae bacterium]|nr:OmpH family outer membrane protein [Selenomonadaceae bacterium]MBR3722580.1 OmpH family outer membrane protein [Selenomonadaceae bacterium]
MVQLEKKHVKIISVLVALIFIGSVVALALTQSGSGIASAASSSKVGVVDYRQLLSQHPKLQEVNNQMQQAVTEAQKEFETKSASMGEQEKADYYNQTQERLQVKQQELFDPIQKSVDEAVKKVADTKGLSVVLDKSTVVYGGQDITNDVVSRLK